MTHDELQSRDAEWIVILRQGADMLSPNRSVGKRLESEEADEGEEIVERVLEWRSTEGGPTRGGEIACSSSLNRSVLLDDAVSVVSSCAGNERERKRTEPRRARL